MLRIPLAVALGAVLFLAGCSNGPAEILTVRINAPTTTLAVGQTAQLTATAIYSDKSELDITGTALWQSPDSAFVVVTPKGVVSGLNPGGGIVRATYFTASSELLFTVK